MLYFDLVKERALDQAYSAGYRDVPENTTAAELQEEILGEILGEESW